MTKDTTTANGSDDTIRAIACALAKIDGYDPEDQNCGLYELRWLGGPNPEPEGDAWHMDYLPKAEKIAAALASTATQPPAGWVMVPVEPTEAMGLAYLAAAKLHAAEGAEDTMRFSWGGYRAMLAAAPKAPPMSWNAGNTAAPGDFSEEIAGLPAEPSGWQSILTAPIDEIVLVAGEFDAAGDWRIKCGYLDKQTGVWRVFGASWEPSRWMPLPPAPKE